MRDRNRPSAAAAAGNPSVEPANPRDLMVVHRFAPLEPNTFRFSPIEAKFVRVDVLASNLGQPCIDEVEIFSGDLPQIFEICALATGQFR